jgi:WD40 repeat protein
VDTRPPPPGTYASKGHCCANLATLSPDGRTLATSAGEKAVQLWDAHTGDHLGTLRQRGFVMALAWVPGDRVLAVNAGVTVRLYDIETRAERVTWPVKYCYIPRLAFSPDGRLAATIDNTTAVHVWDTGTGRPRASLRAGRERRISVAFAPDGLTLAAGGWHGSVAIWDVD